MRRLIFLAISLCGLLTVWPVLPLLAQTTVITAGGGAATSVSAAAFPLLAPSGAVGAPSYAFSAAATAGMTLNGSFPSFTGGGEWKAVIYSGGYNAQSDDFYGWSSSTTSANAAADTGFGRAAAGVAKATLGSSGDGWIQNAAGDQFLTADATNGTTTFSNLTDLTIPSVTSGRKYIFEMTLMCSSSVAADGLKVDFNGGTATATNFRASAFLSSDTGTAVTQVAAASTTLAGVINTTAMASTAQHLYLFKGSFEPSGTGTFIPRFALDAATGTGTVFRGSHLLMKDMP